MSYNEFCKKESSKGFLSADIRNMILRDYQYNNEASSSVLKGHMDYPRRLSLEKKLYTTKQEYEAITKIQSQVRRWLVIRHNDLNEIERIDRRMVIQRDAVNELNESVNMLKNLPKYQNYIYLKITRIINNKVKRLQNKYIRVEEEKRILLYLFEFVQNNDYKEKSRYNIHDIDHNNNNNINRISSNYNKKKKSELDYGTVTRIQLQYLIYVVLNEPITDFSSFLLVDQLDSFSNDEIPFKAFYEWYKSDRKQSYSCSGYLKSMCLGISKMKPSFVYKAEYIESTFKRVIRNMYIETELQKYDTVNPPLIICNKCKCIYKRHMDLAKHKLLCNSTSYYAIL